VHSQLEDDELPLRADLGIELPGIWGGIIYNIHPEWRFFLGVERYLSRYAPFYVEPGSGSAGREKLSISMTEYDFCAGVDHFFRRQWALRAELHYRYANHATPDSDNSQGLLIQTDFKRREPWFGIGIVFHYQ
jgi:long-subunit fatty acid transport protein